MTLNTQRGERPFQFALINIYNPLKTSACTLEQMDLCGEFVRSWEFLFYWPMHFVLPRSTLSYMCTEIGFTAICHSSINGATIWLSYLRDVTTTTIISPHLAAHMHCQRQDRPVWREIFLSSPMTDWQLNGHLGGDNIWLSHVKHLLSSS